MTAITAVNLPQYLLLHPKIDRVALSSLNGGITHTGSGGKTPSPGLPEYLSE